MAILSIDALYDVDNTIFSGLQLPTQLEENRDNVIENILLESFELEILYPDPEVMAKAIEIWSKSRVYTWQKIADALYKGYDPFINFTRDERREHEETRNLAGSAANSGKDKNINSGKGFNSNQFTSRERDVLEHGRRTDTTDTGTIKTVETFHSQGDSALYTPTDVAKKETELRLALDLQKIITNEFINRFCLMIY